MIGLIQHIHTPLQSLAQHRVYLHHMTYTLTEVGLFQGHISWYLRCVFCVMESSCCFRSETRLELKLEGSLMQVRKCLMLVEHPKAFRCLTKQEDLQSGITDMKTRGHLSFWILLVVGYSLQQQSWILDEMLCCLVPLCWLHTPMVPTGQFYVMMTPPDVIQTGAPRSIAPRTQPYPA